MKPIHTFTSIPSLPPKLERLRECAYNLHWSWDHTAIALFRRLDDDLWELSGHNPVMMLGMIEQNKLEEAANDESFMAHLDRVYTDLENYLNNKSTWFHRTCDCDDADSTHIAYFSAEFGITECLSIFAGGLGVLAGDHLKSASDLGVPLVGVGLLYQQGYFRQYLNEAGWQQEAYEDNDFHNLPLTLIMEEDETPLTISIDLANWHIQAQVWKAQVGRISLYLLDTNIPGSWSENRDVTDQLYGGDKELRIQQEILLGIGGYRALQALGITPRVFHMNEGHSAFLALEHIRTLMHTHGISFAEACEAASASLVFTTHTPVAAGQDYFSAELMDRYLTQYATELGLNRQQFLALGRQDPQDNNEPFCMTILALRLSSHSNGVSKLHGNVSRKMWQTLWPKVPQEEIPITHVTNGVHFPSWLSLEINQLYERYLGIRWQTDPVDENIWQRAEHIPPAELWRTHERRRERLITFTRNRLHKQLTERGVAQAELDIAHEVLDPDALTIGFARRFATYKRATLLLRDPDRLDEILNDPHRPVQIIFAGKAHPHDNPGKELIKKIVDLARQERFRRRLVFLENYDMTIARYLVQGCDVWLNTPLRPREASGTSGIKAIANGVLNLSTLDGWWDEAYHHDIGWAIGRGEIYENQEYQAEVEAEALYDLLERDVVPTFYDRAVDGLPRQWIDRMKLSIKDLCSFFNTHRMVQEYTERFYIPAGKQAQLINTNGQARAKDLASWRNRIKNNWHEINIEEVDSGTLLKIQTGEAFTVQASVNLGKLSPDDVSVELYLGKINPAGDILDARSIIMKPVEKLENGSYLYQVDEVSCEKSGQHGYTIRVLPYHPDLVTPFIPGMIVWAS